ncbi:hypothetical protein B0H14DRAFT_2576258 [Mycena olivaceomarginata]|nr:hypothetical protein B0H14DRAFT_2576258 [Mycena olivaceomarginata]
MPSIDDLLDPPEERYVEEGREFSEDADIVAFVRHEEAVARGEIIEVDSDDEDEVEDDPAPEMGTADVCLTKGDPTQSFELSQALRLFRGHVQREVVLNARQTTLEESWGS